MLLGSYTILFTPSFSTTSRRSDVDIDSQVALAIEDTHNRIIYDVKYEPVFVKYYDKYYGNSTKDINNNPVYKAPAGGRSLTGIADTAVSKDKPSSEVSYTERELKFNKLWLKADSYISRQALFPENNAAVNEILVAMETARIVAVDVLDIGEYVLSIHNMFKQKYAPLLMKLL